MKTHTSDRGLQLCLYCPNLCLSRCPASLVSGNITYSAWGKIASAWRVRKKQLPQDADSLAPAYWCLDCLACREGCEHLRNVPADLAALRVEFAKRTTPPVPPGVPAYDMEEAWKLLRTVAPAWRRVDECQALLVPGRELLTEDNADILEAIFKVFERIGDQVVGVNRDSVLECGHHPYAHAHMALARTEAQRAHSRFGRYARVIMGSPHCASFVRLKWPEADLDRSKQCVTLLEFVGRGVDLAQPGFYKKKVACHDPCHLGRHLGLYGISRDLLKWATNVKPVELPYNREKSSCCGGGYPLSTVSPETADGCAQMVMDQFDRVDADVLVTSCGSCRAQLRRAAGSDKKVLHLAEVLAHQA
jgi:Fe-S oxidoreductase